MSTRQVRKARRFYQCPDASYAHDRTIKPGDQYVRVTIFRSDDVFGGDAPRQVVYCLGCGLDADL